MNKIPGVLDAEVCYEKSNIANFCFRVRWSWRPVIISAEKIECKTYRSSRDREAVSSEEQALGRSGFSLIPAPVPWDLCCWGSGLGLWEPQEEVAASEEQNQPRLWQSYAAGLASLSLVGPQHRVSFPLWRLLLYPEGVGSQEWQ